MALPTPEKTWQFAHISNTLTGSQGDDAHDFFLKFKTAAKTFGSQPLTVVGSSNGVSANMSGTDLLAAYSDFVHAVAGSPHSWVVLATAVAQICFDFNRAPGLFGVITLDIITSSAGFSGGSINNRPTASDESVLLTNDSWTGRLGTGSSTGGQIRGHIMLSDDGQCFRVVVANNNTVGGFLLVDKAGGAVSGWTDPVISVFLGQGYSDNTTNNLLEARIWISTLSTAIIHSRGPAGSMPLYACVEYVGGLDASIVERYNGANEISGEYPLLAVGLFHGVTASQRGRHGHISDLWFTNAILANGDTMPSDGSKQFVIFGDVVFPSDGTSWATA